MVSVLYFLNEALLQKQIDHSQKMTVACPESIGQSRQFKRKSAVLLDRKNVHTQPFFYSAEDIDRGDSVKLIQFQCQAAAYSI